MSGLQECILSDRDYDRTLPAQEYGWLKAKPTSQDEIKNLLEISAFARERT